MLTKKLTILLIILSALFIILLLFYFFGQEQGALTGPASPLGPQTELSLGLDAANMGDIGELTVTDEETGEEKPLITSSLPEVIPSTVGIILEIKKQQAVILARGTGSNFVDGMARDLACSFTESIKVTTLSGIKLFGEAGIDVLEPGMQVLISGAENLRGKTEFKAQAIKILKNPE